MNQELYNKLFARMDEVGAIRKDLSFGCKIHNEEFWEWTFVMEATEIMGDYEEHKGFALCLEHGFKFKISSTIWHPPVLSDCIRWCESVFPWSRWYTMTQAMWDWRKPYLHQQSDELGEKLLKLLY